ncbi:MAG: IPTL-CTERM sorting domain-containing protein [Methylococcaceae bacterium]|nr:IPTL-CTERM sorting domain-containing protein [Methylococcaceae bacterium]
MKKINPLIKLFMLLIGVLATTAGFAGSNSYSGTNVGGPEWNRPFADGGCCSGLGPVRYSVQSFYITNDSACDIASVQDGWDGYLFIYNNPFDPTSQTTNFIAGDDDGPGGIGTSNIDGVLLTKSTVYQIVTTGFANGNEGTFTNTVTCQGAEVIFGEPPPPTPPVNPIPTMSEWSQILMMLIMIGTAGWYVRRHKS